MPGRWLKLGPSGLGATAAAEVLLESGAGWPESLEANAEHIARLATSNARENLFRTDSPFEQQWRLNRARGTESSERPAVTVSTVESTSGLGMREDYRGNEGCWEEKA